MRWTSVWLGLVALAACGGPNWKGLYSGDETETETCGVQSGSQTQSSGLDIGTDSSGIFWPITCGVTVHATLNANVATVVPIACPPETSDGVTGTVDITGGSLTLNGDTVTENITATITFDGGGSCGETLSGSFTRQD